MMSTNLPRNIFRSPSVFLASRLGSPDSWVLDFGCVDDTHLYEVLEGISRHCLAGGVEDVVDDEGLVVVLPRVFVLGTARPA